MSLTSSTYVVVSGVFLPRGQLICFVCAGSWLSTQRWISLKPSSAESLHRLKKNASKMHVCRFFMGAKLIQIVLQFPDHSVINI